MKIRLQGELPFITVKLIHQGLEVDLDHVLLDTGSAATLFSVDKAAEIGIKPALKDVVERMFGVGGMEFVISKQIGAVVVDDLHLENFDIQIGTLKYGIDINGIIGVDFLIQTGAIVDFARMEIYSP